VAAKFDKRSKHCVVAVNKTNIPDKFSIKWFSGVRLSLMHFPKKTCPECSFYWLLQHNVYCVYQIWLPPQRNLLECISLGNMRDISNQYITRMALNYWNFTVSVNNGMSIDINSDKFSIKWFSGVRLSLMHFPNMMLPINDSYFEFRIPF
jgi:ribulose 1,5-bisphosphate carboxylase large subunit-like protein